jgi:hypothetical protein
MVGNGGGGSQTGFGERVYDGNRRGDRVRRSVALAVGQLVLAVLCHAEPRWCSVSPRDASNTIVYPPIAAAAQVEGEARARIIYRPNGQVQKVETISGVAMLSITLSDQLANWTVRSSAPGGELCETLVVATFELRKPARRWKQKIRFVKEPNTIRIFVSRPRPEIETEAIAVTRQAY